MNGWSYPYLGGPISEKLGVGRDLPPLTKAMVLSDSEEQVSLVTWISCWLHSVLALSHKGLSDITYGEESALRTTLPCKLHSLHIEGWQRQG